MRLKLSLLVACAFISFGVAHAQPVSEEQNAVPTMAPFKTVPHNLPPGEGIEPPVVSPAEKPSVSAPGASGVNAPSAAPAAVQTIQGVPRVVSPAEKPSVSASGASEVSAPLSVPSAVQTIQGVPRVVSPAEKPRVSAPGASGVSAPSAAPAAVQTIQGMPRVVDPKNIYSEANGLDKLSPVVAHDLKRVYVPNLRGNSVSVIDSETMKVVDTFPVGRSPQHVVPSWDLRTLWVTNNSEGHLDGSLTPIDPLTGKPGKDVTVDDPYNMYFTPDGREAIVVAEAHRRLDFRDPHTMALRISVEVPLCKGINHAAFSVDGRYALFTCEFGGYMAKIDTVNHKLLGMLKLSKGGMPQDVLAAPDGHKFYVADMDADGVFIIDGDNFKEKDFIHTGLGTHGLYPSRDAKFLYVANRGSHMIHGPRHGPGSVSVVDMAIDKVVKNWPISGGGSPDMGNVSADGKMLWLSGRFDDVVYAINTDTGVVKEIPVGAEPHGLTVWPQPGRYSIGHTGITR